MINFRLCLVGAIAFAGVEFVRAESTDRPNILVILTDDQGWGDVSAHGNTNLSTPNVDSLARDGMTLERFYVSPVCSPTRAEFLTGRYHARSGIYGTSAGSELMDLDESTIAEAFQSADYATGAFGKWHNGTQVPYHPNSRGFEEFYGFCSGHWGNYFSPMLDHNGEVVRGDGFVIDDFTDKAMDFIEESVESDRSFFTYVAYNTPHSPMQVPDRWARKFRDKELAMRHRDPEKEDIEHTRAALAMCENIDWNVGRLLDQLETSGVAESTLVLYFCDNGPNGWRWNGGMRGRKGSTDEGGVRSPFFVRWPEAIPGGARSATLAAAIDLFPALIDVAGIDYQPAKAFDGVSLKALWTTGDADHGERAIFSHWNRRVSARSQRYRLDHEGRLYDMTADPGQANDISAANPETHDRMVAAVERWKRDVLVELDREFPPFPVGFNNARWTQLPARDATATGSIERSNRFPNSSYFRNWVSEEDQIQWRIRTDAPGTYRVWLYCGAAKDVTRMDLELKFGDSRLRSRLIDIAGRPEIGAENDLTPRMESYEKEWDPVLLGEITLPVGRGSLELNAVEIEGEQGVEVRGLVFERL